MDWLSLKAAPIHCTSLSPKARSCSQGFQRRPVVVLGRPYSRTQAVRHLIRFRTHSSGTAYVPRGTFVITAPATAAGSQNLPVAQGHIQCPVPLKYLCSISSSIEIVLPAGTAATRFRRWTQTFGSSTRKSLDKSRSGSSVHHENPEVRILHPAGSSS